MGTPEPISCLTVENMPRAFRWRGAQYAVTEVIRSWRADQEWWSSCYLSGTRFWLVEVRNSKCRFELRHDPDGRWWLLRDRAVVAAAA